MNKSVIVSILVVIVLVGGVVLVKGGISAAPHTSASVNNVTVVGGTQIIEINAKGGYEPSLSAAKAGVPTVLRFNTNGTFDCSSTIRIPVLSLSRTLPQTGSTDIDIGTPQIGVLQGTCGMGMYRFGVNFQG